MLNYKDFVDIAMRDPQMAGLRPVVEKEILHYSILYALDNAGLLNGLTFQGGTSLRLLHGAPRFSEDLDFVGGKDFHPRQLVEIRKCVEAHIGNRLGLEVTIKEPDVMREDPLYFGVKTDRWQIAVVMDSTLRNLPKQKIKLEVANVPAYTRELHPPKRNYPGLPTTYEELLVPAESLEEVLADKLVSLVACTNRVRHRDIVDIRWLNQQGAKINMDLVNAKIADYSIDDYEDLLTQRIEGLNGIIKSKAFLDEMIRFVAPEARQRTFDRPGFLDFLANNVRKQLVEVQTSLVVKDVPREEDSFDYDF